MYQIDPERIEKIELQVNPAWLKVCDIHEPTTGLEVKFSYRTTSAMVLRRYDTADIHVFDDAMCEVPELIALRDRVVAIAKPEMTEMQAVVRVTLDDSEVITASHDLDHQASYTQRMQQVKAKAVTLLVPRCKPIFAMPHMTQFLKAIPMPATGIPLKP